VLELCDGVAGPLAGWLLAELGCDVMRGTLATARGRADARGATDLAARVLHRSKRRATALEPAALADVAAAADVLLIDRDRLREAGGALDAAPLLARNPELVHCTVRPFGPRGPLAELPADDALVQAASGIAAMQWSYDGHPVWLNTPLTAYACGMKTALAVAAALYARLGGHGGQRVETSLLGAALLFQSGTYVTGPGSRGTLLGNASDPRGVLPTYAFYRASDDWLFVGALTEVFWVKLCNAIERTDLLAHPELQGIPLSFTQPPERRAFVRQTLEEAFAARPRAEWLDRLAAHDVPCGPVLDREAFLCDPQTVASEMSVEVVDPVLGPTRQPGVPLRFARTPGAIRGPARAHATDAPTWPPRALGAEASHEFARSGGEGSSPTATPRASAEGERAPAPLDGIRVVSFATYIAGALCPMLLADLGADVVKVEPLTGDPFRAGTTFGFLGWNRGKRSLALDLQREEARDALFRLVERADLVIDNYRPGVLARLGLEYPALRARNPRVIQLSLTGYGPFGPLADRPGFDPVMQARSGLGRAQGGDEPVFYAVPYTDYATATLGAFAAVCALLERDGRSAAEAGASEGQAVWTSLLNSACVMQAGFLIDAPGRPAGPVGGRDLRGSGPYRRAYACRDGWIFVSADAPEERDRLRAAFGLPRDEGASGVGGAAERIAAATAQHATDDVLARLRAAGVAAVACPRFPTLVDDPQIRANELWWWSHHAELGDVVQTGALIELSRTPMRLGPVAPRLGEHTREILAELGIDDAIVDEWIAKRIARALEGT
jgi:crotonobetainyl-CoA:carnitine CoA-transferase CaiB-like acyl-CoA transferase